MKMHLNLATRDLDAAVAFYATLLHAQPVKHFADYALFVTEDPRLELALDLQPEAFAGDGAHYGVVANDAEQVDAAIARLRAAGHAIEIWATDPDGRRWETYFVVAEADEPDAAPLCC